MDGQNVMVATRILVTVDLPFEMKSTHQQNTDGKGYQYIGIIFLSSPHNRNAFSFRALFSKFGARAVTAVLGARSLPEPPMDWQTSAAF